MFAWGHMLHQRRIWSASVVASLRPFLVLGCFPGEGQSGLRQSHPPSIGVFSGITAQPAAANADASAPTTVRPTGSVMALERPVGMVIASLSCRGGGRHRGHEVLG